MSAGVNDHLLCPPQVAAVFVSQICAHADNTHHVLQGSQGFGSSLVKHFQGKAASTKTAGTCGVSTLQENEDAAEVVQELSNDKAAGPKVLVVCGGASGTLEDELKTVTKFSKALKAVFGSHVTAYVSDVSSQVCHFCELILRVSKLFHCIHLALVRMVSLQ